MASAAVRLRALITATVVFLGTALAGTFAYYISNLTALIVEGDLQRILRQRKRERTIDELGDHVIVCASAPRGGTSRSS